MADNRKQVQILTGHNAIITRVDWSPDGTSVVSVANDRKINIYDTETGQVRECFESPYSRVTNLCWSPDGRLIAIGSIYEDITLMNARTGHIEGQLAGHSGWVSSMAWSPDGEHIVTVCSDEFIRIWLARKCYLSKSFKSEPDHIKCVTWSPDGKVIATGSSEGEIRLWNVETAENYCVLNEHTDSVNCLAWSPDSSILASSSTDKCVRFWDHKENTSIKIPHEQESSISSLAFSFDGCIFATMDEQGTVILFKCDTREKIESFSEPYTGRLRLGLAFHPKKHHLATISGKACSIHIWDLGCYVNSSVMPGSVKETIKEPVTVSKDNYIVKTIVSEDAARPIVSPETELVKPEHDLESIFKKYPEESSLLPDEFKPDFKSWAGAARCTLAIAFTDILGSTLLGNKLGNNEYSKIRQAHFEQGRKYLKRYNGYEVKTIGDSLMVAFHTATEVLDFALAFYKRTGDDRIRIRVGMHVGPVSIEQNDVFGVAVNFAARIESMAKGAEIWLSSEARAHIEQEGFERHRDIEWAFHADCELKGFQKKQTLWSIENLR